MENPFKILKNVLTLDIMKPVVSPDEILKESSNLDFDNITKNASHSNNQNINPIIPEKTVEISADLKQQAASIGKEMPKQAKESSAAKITEAEKATQQKPETKGRGR